MSLLVKKPLGNIANRRLLPSTLDGYPRRTPSKFTLDSGLWTFDPRHLASILASILIWYYPIDLSTQIFQLINVFSAYVKTIATQRSTTYLSVLHP